MKIARSPFIWGRACLYYVFGTKAAAFSQHEQQILFGISRQFMGRQNW
jgi:hypothetical protein